MRLPNDGVTSAEMDLNGDWTYQSGVIAMYDPESNDSKERAAIVFVFDGEVESDKLVFEVDPRLRAGPALLVRDVGGVGVLQPHAEVHVERTGDQRHIGARVPQSRQGVMGNPVGFSW